MTTVNPFEPPTPSSPPPGPTPTGPPSKSTKPLLIGAIVVLGVFVIGVVLGASGQPEPKVETKTITETKEKEVVSVPSGCAKAISATREIISADSDLQKAAAEGFDASAAGVQAIADNNVGGITAATSRLRDATSDVKTAQSRLTVAINEFNQAAVECRADD